MKVYDTEELDSYNNNGKSSHPIVYTEQQVQVREICRQEKDRVWCSRGWKDSHGQKLQAHENDADCGIDMLINLYWNYKLPIFLHHLIAIFAYNLLE
jgi:hypothetical protein